MLHGNIYLAAITISHIFPTSSNTSGMTSKVVVTFKRRVGEMGLFCKIKTKDIQYKHASPHGHDYGKYWLKIEGEGVFGSL